MTYPFLNNTHDKNKIKINKRKIITVIEKNFTHSGFSSKSNKK